MAKGEDADQSPSTVTSSKYRYTHHALVIQRTPLKQTQFLSCFANTAATLCVKQLKTNQSDPISKVPWE